VGKNKYGKGFQKQKQSNGGSSKKGGDPIRGEK